MYKDQLMRTLLFNPGPTNVSDLVRSQLQSGDVCHRETEFFEMVLRVNTNLVRVLNGEGTHSAVLLTASGTGANESIISSIRGKALVLNNGKYSDRLCGIVERYGIPLVRLSFDPLARMDLELVEKTIALDEEITHILFVHHETTTGALAPLYEIGDLAKQYNKLTVVDTISSLGGHPIDLKKDNITFCSVSGGKCLESFPGVSFVVGKTDEIMRLKGKSRSFYLDLYAHWEKEQRGETPFTPAVQLVFAADAALRQLLNEGYSERVERYKALAARMRDGLTRMGFRVLLLSEDVQSNILTSVAMPNGMDYWLVHDELKARGITIYSGPEVLAQRQFRIATLGSITLEDVDWFLSNLSEVARVAGLVLHPIAVEQETKQQRL
jgi:2-aminoethylphosphonate-pyruvate transaminase